MTLKLLKLILATFYLISKNDSPRFQTLGQDKVMLVNNSIKTVHNTTSGSKQNNIWAKVQTDVFTRATWNVLHVANKRTCVYERHN